MAKLNIVGQIAQIGKVEEFGENGFKKQEIIVKTVEERPNFYVVEFTQKNIEKFEGFKLGDNVNATCNLNGREYTSKEDVYSVFMSLNCWKIESI